MKLRILFFAGTLMFSPIAFALGATCTLNVATAYQKAVKKGWTFKCNGGVLTFDKLKRPGCTAKSFLPNGKASVNFFGTAPNLNPVMNMLNNGWAIKEYEVSGGQYDKFLPSPTVKINFGFDLPKANTNYRRYLSKLVVTRPYGNCNSAIDSAF